ncbi:MAG: hypothetical protein HY437_00320 [Candidatus Magasanikbacteria bacterium]|nr:hypothetical protein [Candidatus Magasanikbacteria bacterium]
MKDKTLWIGVLLIIIAFVGLIVWQKMKPGEYDVLAQCLTDKGVKEYGAYWCPHCQKQKKDFGNSFRKITYIECGLPGGAKAGQTLECDQANIKGYPTWVFPDESRLEGPQTLQTLAEKSGCPLK